MLSQEIRVMGTGKSMKTWFRAWALPAVISAIGSSACGNGKQQAIAGTQLVQPRVHHLAAIAQDDGPVADRLDLLQDVGREDHRVLLLALLGRGELRDQPADLADLQRVEPDGGLVEDQHRRVVDDATRWAETQRPDA